MILVYDQSPLQIKFERESHSVAQLLVGPFICLFVGLHIILQFGGANLISKLHYYSVRMNLIYIRCRCERHNI